MNTVAACLAAILLALAAPVRAADATGEVGPDAFLHHWTVASAALTAFAMTPLPPRDGMAAAPELIARLDGYRAGAEGAVVWLIRAQPPADPTLLRQHFRLLPLFEEAVAAMNSLFDGLKSRNPDAVDDGRDWLDDTLRQIRRAASGLQRPPS